MQKSELITHIKPIFGHLDEIPKEVTFSAKGSTCSVWQIQSLNRAYVLRIIDQTERVLDGSLDAFIRKAVRKNRGRVATSLLNSEGTGYTINDQRWSLDEFAEGTHPSRGKLSSQICKQLGETLAALHKIPVTKCGKPDCLNGQTVVGGETQPFKGVTRRFENPLPETWNEDYLHPILSAAPEIKDEILACLRQMSERVQEGRSVLCHSDLHEGQLICTDNNLIALIDFGDATILDRHWDLGSALYFHGERNFLAIFAAYSDISVVSQKSARLASAFSVAVAMHHASRSRLCGKGHRLERAIQWILSNHLNQSFHTLVMKQRSGSLCPHCRPWASLL